MRVADGEGAIRLGIDLPAVSAQDLLHRFGVFKQLDMQDHNAHPVSSIDRKRSQRPTTSDAWSCRDEGGMATRTFSISMPQPPVLCVEGPPPHSLSEPTVAVRNPVTL